jgi:hypothetical protein
MNIFNSMMKIMEKKGIKIKLMMLEIKVEDCSIIFSHFYHGEIETTIIIIMARITIITIKKKKRKGSDS